jgi:hypothetical protein
MLICVCLRILVSSRIPNMILRDKPLISEVVLSHSHSFISSHFVETHDIPTVALKRHLITKSFEGHIPCHFGVINIPINLSGVIFPTSLMILNSHGIDVILRMDWLTKYRGNIACAEKTVTITNH